MNNQARQFFPLGKAYGAAFCNRVEETEKLVGNIKSCKHTLLIAPRLYGKSSLAERATEKSRFPSIKINFHLCTSEEEVANIIVDGVVKLIGIGIGPIDKVIVTIKKYLSMLEPLVSFGSKVASLKPKEEIRIFKYNGYIPIVLENMGIITKYFESKTNF